MPLTPIDEPGEVDAFGIRFTMEQRGERVRCHVFRSTIALLVERTMIDDTTLLNLFQQHRALFEQVATVMFDAGHRTPWIEGAVSRE